MNSLTKANNNDVCQQLIVDISMHTMSWQQGRHIVFLVNAQYFQRQSSFSNTLSTLLTGLWATGLIFPLDFGTAVFFICLHVYVISRVWRSERGNYNPSIDDGQTTQWPKEKGQRTNNDLQNTTQKTKDRVTRTPLKTGGKLKCSERVSSSCSTSGTCFGF